MSALIDVRSDGFGLGAALPRFSIYFHGGQRLWASSTRWLDGDYDALLLSEQGAFG